MPSPQPAGATASLPGLLRAAAPITAWNLLSRLTGFVRVLAVGAALGTTYLGNTYQSSNLVSNLLFELLAGGVLSSVLVPSFVAKLQASPATSSDAKSTGRAGGTRHDAALLAGVVLGALFAILVPLVMMGALSGRWIMRALTVAVADADVRRQQVELGSFFLWFFLPQVLLYALGAVATALLQADHRFVSAAAAPVANNVAVIATMVAFSLAGPGAFGRPSFLSQPGSLAWRASLPRASSVTASATPTLMLPRSSQLLLAAGTTAGVLAMSAIPLIAAWRAGFRLRPRWALAHPELRSMARQGAWAGLYLGLTQLLAIVTLVLANRVEGGVVAYQIAFTFFLLPYALVANPLLTALYPRLAADALQRRWKDFSERLAQGLRLLGFILLPASALLVALAPPALRLVALGALSAGGGLVASTLAAYAFGLAGYCAFQLLTRAAYAFGDTRLPTWVNLGVAGIGAVLMVAWSAAVAEGERVVVLGFSHSLAQTGGALALFVALERRLQAPLQAPRWLLRDVASSVIALAASAWAAGRLAWPGRAGAAVSLGSGTFAGVAAYLGAQAVLGAPELRQWRPGPRREPGV